jgi:hypothetical protein
LFLRIFIFINRKEMENKMATTLGETFSTNENVVLQHDKLAVGGMAETLVIEFDQDRYEELLSSGKSSHISLHKHRKITIAKAMNTSTSNVSVEDSNVQGKMPLMNLVSNETNQALSKPMPTSVPSGRTDSVFSKTNPSRSKASISVHRIIILKGKACASNGEAKKIAFSKAKSPAFQAKHKDGVFLALNRIKASNSEAKTSASFDAQLALDDEATKNAQLAMNDEAMALANEAFMPHDEANTCSLSASQRATLPL